MLVVLRNTASHNKNIANLDTHLANLTFSTAPGEMATFSLSHTSLCDVCVDSLEEVKSVVTAQEVEV